MDSIRKYLDAIDRKERLLVNDYLEIGRLWNTIAYYNRRESTSEESRFYDIVFQDILPIMVQELHMVVSRGYSFYSQEFDFMFGGILPEQNRYKVLGINKS
jgi:hypothetical protein